MPQRTLRFRISQEGLVEECVEGVVGNSCHQLTEGLEAALGSVQRTEPTSDAFLEPQKQTQPLNPEII